MAAEPLGRTWHVAFAAADRITADRNSAASHRADGALRTQGRGSAGGEGGLGSGRLHVRLVALFTAMAAVPTVLVAIFASVLFQSGLEFWFSDRARSMIENTVEVARASYDREAERVSNETVTMSGDLAGYFSRSRLTTLDLPTCFLAKCSSETLGSDHLHLRCRPPDSHAGTGQPLQPATRESNYARQDRRAEDASQRSTINSADRIGAVTPINYGPTLISTLHACSIPSSSTDERCK